MNLIKDAWIPIRRKSGVVKRIAPYQITEGMGEDEIIDLAAPRPDFNGALIQFLIGLLQTACAPENPRQWRKWLQQPPNGDELMTAFEPIACAFELDGNGKRFMQDLTLEGEIRKLQPNKQKERKKPIYELLIDMTTKEKLKENADHFIKRGKVEKLCPECAAIALFTLQTNAPKGGRGHRTGLRGGGPMTTLVTAETLWLTCWLNILERQTFLSLCGNREKTRDSDRFPWLSQTRTSEGDVMTTPEDVHPDQVLWSMPRRIRLIIDKQDKPSACDLCGESNSVTLSHFLTKNHGVNYEGPWRHSLSPYSIAEDKTPAAIHPQPGGIGYRHWLGLVQVGEDSKGKQQPARAVENFIRHKQMDLRNDLRLRLWAFGYNMEDMKARCWYDSTMPLLLINQDLQAEYENRIGCLVKATKQVCGALILSCLRACYFNPSVDKNKKIIWKTPKSWRKFSKKNEDDVEDLIIKETKSFSETIRLSFWQETEADFFNCLNRLREALNETNDVMPILENWREHLAKAAEDIFNDVSQNWALDAAGPKRIALAWRDLQRSVHGKRLREQLGLPTKL